MRWLSLLERIWPRLYVVVFLFGLVLHVIRFLELLLVVVAFIFFDGRDQQDLRVSNERALRAGTRLLIRAPVPSSRELRAAAGPRPRVLLASFAAGRLV